MKLAPLLVEYLIANKQLSLPGIGVFRLEPTELKEQNDDKKISPGHILFQSDPTIKDAPELTSFIASKTGKMKALAASDLKSQLELGQEFLNIDKTFVIEGIGSLVKLRTGEFEFTQYDTAPDKLKTSSVKETTATPPHDYKSVFRKNSSVSKMRAGKFIPALLVIAGIGLAVFIGYKIYEKRIHKNTESATTVPETQKNETVPVTEDNSGTVEKTETLNNNPEITTIQNPLIKEDSYKFIVEEADKARALARYNTFRNWGLQIHIETSDSVHFKLFFALPSAAIDTAKTMDSLRLLYTPLWSRSYVEN